MITVRKTKLETDYPVMARWWMARQEPVPREWIPEATSWMAELDGKPICGKSLLLTNSQFAMFEFAVSDPESRWEDRRDAIAALNEALIAYARAVKIPNLFMFSNNPRTWAKAQDSGFLPVADGYKMLVRRVECL